MPPFPQKVRKQRRKLALTVVGCITFAVAMASVFACSWLWQVLIGRG